MRNEIERQERRRILGSVLSRVWITNTNEIESSKKKEVVRFLLVGFGFAWPGNANGNGNGNGKYDVFCLDHFFLRSLKREREMMAVIRLGRDLRNLEFHRPVIHQSTHPVGSVNCSE